VRLIGQEDAGAGSHRGGRYASGCDYSSHLRREQMVALQTARNLAGWSRDGSAERGSQQILCYLGDEHDERAAARDHQS